VDSPKGKSSKYEDGNFFKSLEDNAAEQKIINDRLKQYNENLRKQKVSSNIFPHFKNSLTK